MDSAAGADDAHKLPPAWRHKDCPAYPKPCVDAGKTFQLRPADAARATISRHKTFVKGEATAAQVRYIMSRASCRKVEVVHRAWMSRLQDPVTPLPEQFRRKEDLVRMLMVPTLNDMVLDFCPEVIEVD